ncbi:MAG: hypothetical protein KGZ51_06180 [Erysipelothrix sp.]|jgi:phytol kinase|nr:hypothetical protein [Erysipelothrix sp.]
MNNIYGLIISFVYIFALIGISTVLSNKKIFDGESSRKFIHIMVSNWWFIAIFFFDNVWFAAITPAAFVGINYYSYKNQTFKAMERDGSKKDLGTVYYVISLLILTLVTMGNDLESIGAIGILTLGYGDGFAAVVGEKRGKTKIKIGDHFKSLEGTLMVAFFGFAISGFVFASTGDSFWIIKAILVGLVSASLELYTKDGFDNITLPLGASLLSYLLMLV